jgi:hypothetical protein
MQKRIIVQTDHGLQSADVIEVRPHVFRFFNGVCVRFRPDGYYIVT